MRGAPPGMVVIGGHVNGLGIVRQLAAQGIDTAVVCTQSYDLAHRSRWVKGFERCHDLHDDPGQLVEALQRRARDWKDWAVYPTNDESLYAVTAHRDSLRHIHRVIAPPAEVVETLLNKRRMLDVVQKLGIDAPRNYGPAESVLQNATELEFPVLVKPCEGYRFSATFGVKLFVARNLQELEQHVARVTQHDIACDVFDMIPGDDDQIFCYCVYMSRTGEPMAGLTVRKIRQSPSQFGVARVAELVPEQPELCDATVELLRAMNYTGFAVGEFKRDARNQRWRFIEVNGRSIMYNTLLARGGLDIAALTWAENFEGGIRHCEPTGWDGVWIHLHADILRSLTQRRAVERSENSFLAPYRRKKTYAVWSASDPMPFLTEWGLTAREFSRHLVRGTLGQRLKRDEE